MKKNSNYIGIDVSKKTLDIVLYNMDLGKKSPHLNVSNTKEGFEEIINWLKMQNVKLNKAFFCMEYTGIYSDDIASFLNEKKLSYTRVSPLHMKRSMGLTRGKNDKIDAFYIAKYCYSNKDELTSEKASIPVIKDLKRLLSERIRLVKLKTANKIFIAEKKLHVNKRAAIRAKLLLEIYQTQIKEIESEMENIITNNSDIYINYKLMRSVIGIGLISATMIITYTNNLLNISDARKFASYCGVAPFEHSSGTSIKGKTRVSPFANKKIKGALSNGARAAVQFDPELKKYCERKLNEGKHYGVVMNAVKFKLINRVFATVKRGTPYVVLKQAG